MTKSQQRQYLRQIQGMIDKGHKWMRDHPGADVKIQWNIPPKVFLIQAISEAVAAHTVSTNPEGLELLKALGPWDDQTEPTVLMCRVALDGLERRLNRRISSN